MTTMVATGAPEKKYISKFPMMGTIVSLTLFEKNPDVVNDVNDYLVKMDAVFSANRDDSELSKVNQAAGLHPVTVSRSCYELVADALTYTNRFADSFNVLIGPLVKTWKIGFGGRQVPDDSQIDRALKLIEPGKVTLNPQDHTIFLRDRGMQLDLGAIAKGYFADRIIERLKNAGIRNAIINLGGNVQVLGDNPFSNDLYWNIGIRDPEREDGSSAAIVHTKAQTFVTSGIRERYFKANGHVYHHILSPATGYPVNNDIIQVTIITANSELAEVLSTVCFFHGVAGGKAIIEKTPGVEAIFINQQNQLIHTSGLIKISKGVYLNE
jgi:thiamine biosynthesis lipoprotein